MPPSKKGAALPREPDSTRFMIAHGATTRKRHIRKLWLFGSVLRQGFGPDSDVDVLVEFDEGKTPGLAFFDLEEELAEIIGRPVDVMTEPSLRNPFLRHEILGTRRLVYAT